MKKLIFFCSCAVFFLIYQTTYCQVIDQDVYKYRVLLRTGQRIEIEKGQLTDTTLIDLSKQGTAREIPITDIRALDRRVGSQAVKGALIGTGLGLLTSVLAIVQVQSDPNRKLKDNAGAICAGITVGCGVVGLLVGLAYDDWETVKLKVPINAYFNKDGYQLSMRIYF